MKLGARLICFTILLLISIKGQTPNWEWAITSEGSFPYTCFSAITEDGEVFLAGSFWGAFSTPLGDLSESNQSLRPIYFAQLSSSGEWNWANRCEITIDQNLGYNAFCDLNKEVAVDETRNLYFIVNANGYADYTFGTHTVPGGTNRDFIVKVNYDGVTQWVKALNETPNETDPRFTENLATINAIAVDRNSNILVAGSCWGKFSIDSDTADYDVAPFTTAFYAKIDSYGNVEWIKTSVATSTQSHFAEINDIQVDQSNNYYFAGNYDYEVNFGEGNKVVGSTGDFVIKTFTNGDVDWIFGTEGGTEAKLTTNTLPSIYVSTKFYGNFEVGDQSISKPNQGASCIFQISKSGQFRWYKEFGHSGFCLVNVKDMDDAKQGNILITGDFGGEMTYGVTTLTSMGLGDGFILSINEEGNTNWIKRFGGTGNDVSRSISINSYGVMAISGEFDLTTYFDNLSLSMPDADYDLFVAELGSATGINSDDKMKYEFSLSQNYPNPFNPTTKINYSIAEKAKVHLVVYDVIGRSVEVLVDEFQVAGTYSIDFNAHGLSSGVYFYRITSGQFSETRKLILLR